ncbi:epoxide hydrolase family protein [Paracidovorax konjaci]|uniref:Pimeloyl-ACP methyl ester carboxylesterase n=1 Tax=Paracidovorax konjaci TaxID=32040 RepID=A0A1I1S4L0_9BURK|nr:Pimeloyl-ACP methyl ester carboxylesterase [Paracidovorax konjaci]
MKITPFRIDIPEQELTDLHRRLDSTRWPDDFAAPGWEDGTPTRALRDVVEYWRREFDWRAAEHRLNALPQFIAEVDGHAVHYVHAKGADSASAPLVITHGWPGSFVEMYKVLPLLTHPEQNGFPGRRSFDVVVPSLPGFGFSAAPTQPGMSSRKVASLWHALMHGLGYTSFFAQGGDIGSGVSMWLARLHPESVRALHLNFISAGYQPPLGDGDRPLSAVEAQWLASRAQWMQAEGGYSHIHATKPRTLAQALVDSPSGLAAWLLEKFYAWSDGHGAMGEKFELDELLANVSIYWFSRNVGATLRMYKEKKTPPRRSASRTANGSKRR